MYVLDAPIVAPALDGTPPPPAAALSGLPGAPGWDDAWCAHQTRPTHSPPFHVPLPTSTAAHPPPLIQMRVLLMPDECPQGRLHALQLTWHDLEEYQLFVPVLFVPRAAPGDRYALQSLSRLLVHCVQGVQLLSTRTVHHSQCNRE